MSGKKRSSPYVSGQTFGEWTFVADAPRHRRRFMGLCRCSCGTEKVVLMTNLVAGLSKSCGCGRKGNGANLVKELTGQRFGRLEVLERAGSVGRKATWRCRCDCGEEAVVSGDSLRSGHTSSCGCANRPRGGASSHRLYATWAGMMQRCYNEKSPAYPHYGGRGIKVCERWHDPWNFFEDMHPTFVEGLSIDRIDNDNGYSKDNCRWATWSQQVGNRRARVYVQTPLGVFPWRDAAFMYGKSEVSRFKRREGQNRAVAARSE